MSKKRRLVDTFCKADLVDEIISHAQEMEATEDVFETVLKKMKRNDLKKLLVAFGDEGYNSSGDEVDVC